MSRHNDSGNRRSRGYKRSRLPKRTRSRSPSYKRSKLSDTSLEYGYDTVNRSQQFEDMLVFFFILHMLKI